MDYIKATEKDIQNNKLHIDIEELINSTAESFGISDKDYLEEMYLKGLGLTKEDGEVIWEDGKIIGFKPYKPCEYVSFTIKIDDNNVNVELD